MSLIGQAVTIGKLRRLLTTVMLSRQNHLILMSIRALLSNLKLIIITLMRLTATKKTTIRADKDHMTTLLTNTAQKRTLRSSIKLSISRRHNIRTTTRLNRNKIGNRNLNHITQRTIRGRTLLNIVNIGTLNRRISSRLIESRLTIIRMKLNLSTRLNTNLSNNTRRITHKSIDGTRLLSRLLNLHTLTNTKHPRRGSIRTSLLSTLTHAEIGARLSMTCHGAGKTITQERQPHGT